MVPQVGGLWSPPTPPQSQPHNVPAQLLREGNNCVTSKGHIGSCTTYRNCYPYFKIPDLTIWESWILGNYDTCSFFDADGRQAFGVCCSNPLSIVDQQQQQQPIDDSNHKVTPPAPPPPPPNQDNNYPNWPPPIPTHPPNHAAPTHPPVSGSLPGGTTTSASVPTNHHTTTTTRRPSSTTWPTKPTTVSSNWPPSAPTHKPPIYTTTESFSGVDAGDNEIGGGACGAKNGLAVISY